MVTAAGVPESLLGYCSRHRSVLCKSSMGSTYSVTEAQSQLPGLIRKAEAGEAVRIRRRDQTVALLVSRERMEAIVETMELLANPKAMKAIGEHRAGRTKFQPLSSLDD